MDLELIDLVYRNDEVEGVAIATATGEIIENQLAATGNSVQNIGSTIATIAQGLAQAKRKLRGFLLQSDTTILQVCVFEDFIVFIQLNEPFSATKVEKSVRSIFGGVNERAQTPQAAITEAAITKAAETEAAKAAEPPADHIALGSFADKLSTLLKRVAPSNVASKMIKDGFNAADVDIATTDTIAKQKAIDIGATIIEKIPNASRRKIIIKEYDTITKSL